MTSARSGRKTFRLTLAELPIISQPPDVLISHCPRQLEQRGPRIKFEPWLQRSATFINSASLSPKLNQFLLI